MEVADYSTVFRKESDDLVEATMSTSLVHLLTIVGTASQEVEAACNEMLDRRSPRSPPAPDRITAVVQKFEAKRLTSTLK